MSLSHVERRFLYYTECALATVEGMPKSWSKSQRQRLMNIADGMVTCCRGFLGTGAVVWEEAKAMSIPRTIKRLSDNSNFA